VYSLSGGLSVKTVLFLLFFCHVKVDMAVNYIPVIKKVIFIAVLDKLGEYKNLGVQIIQKFLILTEK
jgi:hypothetical protein